MTTPTDTVDDFDVDTQPAAREPTVQTIERTLAILEIVAERGGASAREVSDALGYPIPTVYRLMQTLVKNDYLVHLRTEHRFELGFKLDRLGVSLHRQVGVPGRCARRSLAFTTVRRRPHTSRSTAEWTSWSPTSSTALPTPGSPRSASASTKPRTPRPSERSCSPG